MIYRVHIKLNNSRDTVICEASSPVEAITKVEKEYEGSEAIDVAEDGAIGIIT